jgi:D-serine deaminase-like pyridoxal phosphate-dependent protein
VSAHEYEVGLHKDEIDTPALLLDLRAMEHNLSTMAAYFDRIKPVLRPHVKLHRATPILAHKQMQAGAIGLTCAKLSEAEALAACGITDILIANQVVGARKIQRLVNLASYTDVLVAVDSYDNVLELSAAAQARGVELRVLVEVNIGHNRCGVEPLEPALALSKAVHEAPGLRYMGLMGYDGHCTFGVEDAQRSRLSKRANTLLVDTRHLIERAGLTVDIVSAGGTFTYRYAADIKGVTEIQAGTYLLMDTAFKEKDVGDFDCALTVLSTVTSRPSWKGAENLAIIDLGSKGISTLLGDPEIKDPQGAKVIRFSQEHGRVDVEHIARDLRIGDKVELWVRDANGTINLFDKFYAMRDDVVEAVWEIPNLGNRT